MPILDLLLSGGVAVALVGILSKYLERRWDKKNAVVKTSARVIKTIASVYQSMQKALVDTDIERVVILKAENGGGKPKVGAHIYISAIMEVHSINNSILDNYQRLRADSSYVEILSDLISKGKVVIDPTSVDESLLKTIYQAEKITYSEIYYLHATEEAIFYCSFATTKPNANFQIPSTALAINIVISQISEIFKNNL